MKVKLFDIKTKTDASEINNWLKLNPNITILGTNTFSNDHGWGYIILYNDREDHE
jgi:hypothetical protein